MTITRQKNNHNTKNNQNNQNRNCNPQSNLHTFSPFQPLHLKSSLPVLAQWITIIIGDWYIRILLHYKFIHNNTHHNSHFLTSVHNFPPCHSHHNHHKSQLTSTSHPFPLSPILVNNLVLHFLHNCTQNNANSRTSILLLKQQPISNPNNIEKKTKQHQQSQSNNKKSITLISLLYY